MAGDRIEILPQEIRLTLGVRDILVLKNLDDVPQIFGPTLMMPGQSFRLPFALASRYQFACTAHASGQMTIIVDPLPASPWTRLRWRVRELFSPHASAKEEESLGVQSTRPTEFLQNEMVRERGMREVLSQSRPAAGLSPSRYRRSV